MNPEWYLEKAQTFYDKGQIELELKILAGLVKNPLNEELRIALSNIYYYQSNYKECLYELEQLKRLSDNLNVDGAIALVKQKLANRPMQFYG